jgi:predicted ABC-type ATPase
MRRYDRSLHNLAAAVRAAHQTVIYDNTEPELRTLIYKDENAILRNTLPRWRRLDPALADAIAAAVGMKPETNQDRE